jgi:hypothetical protein
MSEMTESTTVRVELTLTYDVNIAEWAKANDCPATAQDVRYDFQSYWTAEHLIRPGNEGIVQAVEDDDRRPLRTGPTAPSGLAVERKEGKDPNAPPS